MESLNIIYPKNNIQPIGVIEFVHDFCEDHLRYKESMETFAKYGFICAAKDLKGHGDEAVSDDELGYFGDNACRAFVNDLQEHTMYLKREFQNLPIILLGCGVGSLIVRMYIKRYSRQINAAVLCGTLPKNTKSSLLGFFSKALMLFRGGRYKSQSLWNFWTSNFEKPFLNEGIINSWLSSKRSVVEYYNKDPLCGFVPTLNGCATLSGIISHAYAKTGWLRKDTNLPVMFLSGSNDPFRGNDKSFKKSVTTLKRCGYQNTYYKLYQDMRHDVFHEKNNAEVYDDIIKFLEIKAKIEQLENNIQSDK